MKPTDKKKKAPAPETTIPAGDILECGALLRKNHEKELHDRMDRGDAQLSIFDLVESGQQPFMSQAMIEKDTVFLPNAAKARSALIFKSAERAISIGKAGGNTEYGVLKIKHKDVLYAVLAIWSSHGYPCTTIKGATTRYGVIRTTRYRILSLMHPDVNPGKSNYQALADTLHELKSIPVEVQNTRTKDVDAVFTLFAKYDFKKTGEGDEEIVEILLNETLTERYYRKMDIKLLWFNVYSSLKTDLAKILYPLLDRYLTTSQTGTYHKLVKDLCEENGLAVYRFNAKYREKWKGSIEELNGIHLTNGKKLSLTLTENRVKALILEAKAG